MARKTKEILNNEEVLEKDPAKSEKKAKKETEKKSTKKKETAKKSTSLSTTKSKKEVEPEKNTKAKLSTKKPVKTVSSEKSSSKKSPTKTTTKRSSVKKKTANKTSTKKTAAKKTTTKKSISKSSAEKKPTVFTPEYYDLPYRYNQTVVKILAQTPTSLFIYWDISDDDRNNLKQTYGKHVFEITKPVLIIHNLTMNYSFEVDINDFANSWYLHINDSKCEYDIELGRRPIPINYAYINNYNEENETIKPVTVPYIYISSSNKIESPNNKILFNKEQNKIYFRNVKTNEVIAKDANTLVFISNIGRFYGIPELYNKFFREDEIIRNDYILNNPSSGNPSSGMNSSIFK